eukprot:1567049-Prymnesium_polylepis.2
MRIRQSKKENMVSLLAHLRLPLSRMVPNWMTWTIVDSSTGCQSGTKKSVGVPLEKKHSHRLQALRCA